MRNFLQKIIVGLAIVYSLISANNVFASTIISPSLNYNNSNYTITCTDPTAAYVRLYRPSGFPSYRVAVTPNVTISRLWSVFPAFNGAGTWNAICLSATQESFFCPNSTNYAECSVGHSLSRTSFTHANAPIPYTINFTPAANGFGNAAHDASNFFIWLAMSVMGAVFVVSGVGVGLRAVGRRFGLLKAIPDGGAAGDRASQIRASEIVRKREGMKEGDMWRIK
jgi:hypothetical protein